MGCATKTTRCVLSLKPESTSSTSKTDARLTLRLCFWRWSQWALGVQPFCPAGVPGRSVAWDAGVRSWRSIGGVVHCMGLQSLLAPASHALAYGIVSTPHPTLHTPATCPSHLPQGQQYYKSNTPGRLYHEPQHLQTPQHHHRHHRHHDHPFHILPSAFGLFFAQAL